jgi:hypothetical protein
LARLPAGSDRPGAWLPLLVISDGGKGTEHRKRIRPSNLTERTFGETRRRVKVIGRLPGEQSRLSLVWAVLDRASKGWRGLTMTPRRCAGCRTCDASRWPDHRVTTATRR